MRVGRLKKEEKKHSYRSLRAAFVLYNLISEDVLIDQSAKYDAGWFDLVCANKGLQHTRYCYFKDVLRLVQEILSII